MSTAGSHHHCFCLALHGWQRHLAEFLNDDSTLLVNHMLVIVMERLDSFSGWCLLVFWIFCNALGYLVAHTIGRIAQQHILDKSLLDSLKHRICMKCFIATFRRVNILMSAYTKSAKCLWLRGCGEGIE